MTADLNAALRFPLLPLTPVIAERMTELLEVWPQELTLENLAETRAASDEKLYARTIEEHVGERALFRDESVDYARRLWLAGVPAELHVWTGGCHVFYALIPELPLAQVVYMSRLEWLQRTLVGTVRDGESQ
jgi:acetyl esterase/lipase